MTENAHRLTYLISSLEMGGAERGMVRLINELNGKYDTTVVALQGGKRTIVDDVPSNVEVIDLDIESTLDVRNLSRLWREINKADVLVCSLYHAAVIGTVLGRLRRVPTILTWQHNESFQNSLRQTVFDLAARLSDQVLADSEAVASMLSGTFNIPDDVISTVPIAGVDTEQFAPTDNRASSDSEREKTVVGILGTITEQKNHDAVLAAAERLQDEAIEFEVAGDGPRREELESEASRRNLNITFHGFVSDAPTFLNRLDIYVQPSHYEGLCITAIEAMACGLPVVATEVGGLTKSIVDGKTGYLVPPNNHDVFTERIRQLHQSPKLREQMGRNGRASVIDKYSRETLIWGFEAAITEARSSSKR